MCTETWNCWPLSLTCNQEKYQVFPWWFQLEQLTEKMKSSPPNLLDFNATVSVLLYKKMEVRYLQCRWYMVMSWIQYWELNLVQNLITIILGIAHSNHKVSIILVTTSNFLEVVADWKKKPFYFISLFGEAII